ncbi:cytochrome p450 protein [Cordyceps javanica]|uniref:Cytochrome p450 protein n=1 Tax=Cordyceps javanica TaxID=43265 RepID=A0A545V6R3_9HYPO|nr:cytochrome p450 protein [Cordyceps javanica]
MGTEWIRGQLQVVQCLGLSLPYATTVILSVVTLYIVLRYMSSRKLHPSEPTVLVPWIPLVGHLLGMALQGGRYMKHLALRSPHEPIFTLLLPGSRIYVVTDPSLAAAVQRNSGAFSFTPLIPDITKRVLGLDDETVKIVRQNLDPGPGEARGFLADMHDLVYRSLGPGHYLDSLSCDASQELCRQLCKLQTSLQQRSWHRGSTDLLSLVRHIVTTGTARYLFGDGNPISQRPELESAFWDFDKGLGGLLIGIFPYITACQAYRGRETVVAAFVDYLTSHQDAVASQVVRDRIRVEREWEMSTDMIARSALSFLFAGIVNTTTTTFWVVVRLFADPRLLEIVREEIKQALVASEEHHGPDTLSITFVRDKCPTLSAVFKESLRTGSENFSVRLVTKDTMLVDKYFLRRGAIVQISGGVIHADKSIWGDDADQFNHNRFLGAKSRGGVFHPAAFRGFGGGKTLCPGRHFAINEILLFTAMIVLSFDMESADGGPIRVPPKNDSVMPVHILEPGFKDRPKVIIKPRDDGVLLSRLVVTT